ncbi:MAG: hypothetical protein M5U01_17650 [Ardenticatenaceae bacterium]|nr:hypothetical protein [Ardenticatenaceae bacterium]HBY92963.1 hypothetical protein [Chloroflexota bacterium]
MRLAAIHAGARRSHVLRHEPDGTLAGYSICAGVSGHGFKLGPAVGVMAADMLTGISNPQFDSRLFRLGRYADNQSVRGLYDYSIVG